MPASGHYKLLLQDIVDAIYVDASTYAEHSRRGGLITFEDVVTWSWPAD